MLAAIPPPSPAGVVVVDVVADSRPAAGQADAAR
ncbi:hypothetical protein SAMN06893096_10591 [Geodermatophilus pulveris]|uniref:Uncharacterized protein n=1 Tax=Geodermatophilus pulveris TaxID=1564159 RepID=A0A239FH98_9ACTN|nr:hypothetical protein SAMN06893096_10591 [Geodermatophilus pulveris]